MSDFLDDVVIPNHPCPPARCSAEQWEAEAAQLEHVRGAWSTIAVEAAEARTEYLLAENGRYAGYEAVHSLARAGASFADIARIVGDTVENVVRLFCQADEDVKAFRQAEQILRQEGCRSQAEVARRTGLSRNQLHVLCAQLGIKSMQTASMEAGGGRTISPERYAKIRTLREAGKSAAQIAAIVGVKPNTATRICTRNGWVKGGAK
jgi:DNA-binding CsgD family transcriptional regulator